MCVENEAFILLFPINNINVCLRSSKQINFYRENISFLSGFVIKETQRNVLQDQIPDVVMARSRF